MCLGSLENKDNITKLIFKTAISEGIQYSLNIYTEIRLLHLGKCDCFLEITLIFYSTFMAEKDVKLHFSIYT